jgi:hypothetical protein
LRHVAKFFAVSRCELVFGKYRFQPTRRQIAGIGSGAHPAMFQLRTSYGRALIASGSAKVGRRKMLKSVALFKKLSQRVGYEREQMIFEMIVPLLAPQLVATQHFGRFRSEADID